MELKKKKKKWVKECEEKLVITEYNEIPARVQLSSKYDVH